ncbi:hypothetical protein ACQPW3_22430 [Actinosynnema sp. CA-248983]
MSTKRSSASTQTEHYDERQLSALLVAIATVNVWNRLNSATKQVAGAWG